MYDTIIDPNNKKKYNIKSINGKATLRKYIRSLGGAKKKSKSRISENKNLKPIPFNLDDSKIKFIPDSKYDWIKNIPKDVKNKPHYIDNKKCETIRHTYTFN